MVTRVLLGTLAVLLGGSEARAGCSGLTPPPNVPSLTRRPIEAADLVRLRDIGGVDARLIGDPPMALSPDGTQIAFHLRQADPESNGYCQGIYLLDIRPDARPRLLDAGGELIQGTYSIAGFENFPGGGPQFVLPRWSPDGKWIAFLKRTEGRIDVWRVPVAGGPAVRLTRSATDVDDFEWTRDGGQLVLATRPGILAQRAATQAEADGGHLYDDRFFPTGSSRPITRGPLAIHYQVLDIATETVRDAWPGEEAPLASHPATFLPVLDARGPDGWAASNEIENPTHFLPTTRLRLSRDGRAIPCREALCGDRVQGLWWLAAGDLLILRTEGVNRGTLAFYRWKPGRSRPRAVLRTTDRLIGCQLAAIGSLVCAHEGSIEPRSFRLLDPEAGRLTSLLNLNPEFENIALSPARRLVWRDVHGTQTYGDLILPPDHRPGQRHPLIVTQYNSQGFLRGATGDEYPIQLFARRGYAVLSFQKPPEDWIDSVATSFEDFYRIYQTDWQGRRRIVASLEAGVHAAAALGVVDLSRVGITGLSDGVPTATFALINRDLFAAAAISTCCEEPGWVMGYAGPAYEAMARSIGFPRRDEPGFEAFWKPYSLAMNAANIKVPILIQASEWEFRLATETYSALTAAGSPVEMYVFPDEAHLKVWPRHRFAVYERNLDWFDYWLRDLRDPDPAKAAQYGRWDTLSRRRSGGHGQSQPANQASTSASANSR